MTQCFQVLSLFSGAGGLDLGFESTGEFQSRFGNELKRIPAQTYSSNFGAQLFTNQPSVSDFPAIFSGSVADLKFGEFTGFHPNVIIGGPPCQDFSVVRGPQTERGGISVTRGKLYSYYVDALIHLQPEAFVFENVPGLKSANQGHAYEIILHDFEALRHHQKEITSSIGNHSESRAQNYRIAFSDIVNASKLGVPQARRRLIIIGLRKDLHLPPSKREMKREIQTRLGTESGGYDKWSERIAEDDVKEHFWIRLTGEDRLVGRYPLTPLEVFEGKPLPELQAKYAELMKEYEGIAEEVRTAKALKWKRKVWENLSFDITKDYLAVNKIVPRNRTEPEEAFEEHSELLKELGYFGTDVSKLECRDGTNQIPRDSAGVLDRMRRIPPDENHEFVRKTEWEVEGKGMSLIYRRLHPLKPAYTVVAFGGGGTWGYHYERKRGTLSNRERARLQTFPDYFWFTGSRQEVRAQIGEAVPPLLSKRIAQTIAEVLKSTVITG